MDVIIYVATVCYVRRWHVVVSLWTDTSHWSETDVVFRVFKKPCQAQTQEGPHKMKHPRSMEWKALSIHWHFHFPQNSGVAPGKPNQSQEQRKRGFQKRVLTKCTPLWGPNVLPSPISLGTFCLLGAGLGSAETPFAKTPLSLAPDKERSVHELFTGAFLGNHLTWPGQTGNLPAYVMPAERDGLFWVKDCLAGTQPTIRIFLWFFESVGSRPGKPNQRKGQNEKFMNFAPIFSVSSGMFFLRKTSMIHISNFCSGMPLWRVHELTFLWFGLPGPLLKNLGTRWPGKSWVLGLRPEMGGEQKKKLPRLAQTWPCQEIWQKWRKKGQDAESLFLGFFFLQCFSDFLAGSILRTDFGHVAANCWYKDSTYTTAAVGSGTTGQTQHYSMDHPCEWPTSCSYA